MHRYAVPSEHEPRLEAWLDRREIHYEVAVSKKPGRLIILVDFTNQERYRDMFENQVRKIPGGKILKKQGG